MSNIFKLEVIQAKKGDCLIVHYGNENKPQFILIDGGPGGVYSGFLKKRLVALSKKFGSPLNLSLVMVSHIDDDHINGILDLLSDLKQAKEDSETPLVSIRNIWYNTFDDIINNIQLPQISGGVASVASVSNISGLTDAEEHIKAVIASTNQGRTLEKDVVFLGILKNQGNAFMAGIDKIDWLERMDIILLHPNKKRLQELQDKWDKDLKKAKEKGDDSIIFASLKSRDTSPFNLASIVCLLKYKGKSVLLTGDARGDDIIEGLKESKLLKKRSVRFNVLKVPHHGSSRNISIDFFKTVQADTYIFSGDGTHDNPDEQSLDWLLEASKRRRKEFMVMFTNIDGKKSLGKTVSNFKDKIKKNKRNIKVTSIPAGKLSLPIDLS